MTSELQDFHRTFFQSVHSEADAYGAYAEDAFFDLFCSNLIDAGELDTADRASYIAPRGVCVDGYGGDPLDSEGVLSLIIADFNQSDEIRTLTATDMDAIFNRLQQFLTKSLDSTFRAQLEETSAAFGLSDMIAMRWSSTTKVRLFLISNRVLSSSVDGRPGGIVQNTPVTYSVWDLSRLNRFVVSGHGREDIEIDLAEYGGLVPGLPAHFDGAGYEAYLAVLPGRQLAAIYDHWGARLLEQNVRCFLQAKGNVNRGIRSTIESSPEMFFAYNNGITATAEAVDCVESGTSLRLARLRNLQIVNGGQTTASIHAASKKKDVDLSKVFVQMKLSIIPPDRALDVVPRISQFANSQNRVNAADFFANHPFHIKLEEFSRRIFAPSPDGTFRETKWFYERARGQYQDARAYLTGAAKRKFDAEYPFRQLITKTDLAKFLNVWLRNPHIVSLGAQKNFAQFAEYIGTQWSKDEHSFNEAFYREAVAKAIIFREVEKLVTAQPWYEGGYRANVVAYAVSKLEYEVSQKGLAVDFEAVWKRQGISSAMHEAFTLFTKAVQTVIVNPTGGINNVTEWAKKVGCWQRIMDLRVDLPTAFTKELIGIGVVAYQKKNAVKQQKLLSGVEAMIEVTNKGAEFWRLARDWGKKEKLLSVRELDILGLAAEDPTRTLSDKQSLTALDALRKLKDAGFVAGNETTN